MGRQKVVLHPLGKLARPSSKQFVVDMAPCCSSVVWEVVLCTNKTARAKRVVCKVLDKVLARWYVRFHVTFSSGYAKQFAYPSCKH